MTVRNTLLSAVSVVALTLGAQGAMADPTNPDSTSHTVDTNLDVYADNPSTTDADVFQRGSGGEAVIDQSGAGDDDGRAFIEQTGDGNKDAFIKQNTDNVLAIVDQAGQTGTVDVEQLTGAGGHSDVEVDQRNSRRSEVNVTQSAMNSTVDIEQTSNDATANVRQGGNDNLVAVDLRNRQSREGNVDVNQAGNGNTARVFQ